MVYEGDLGRGMRRGCRKNVGASSQISLPSVNEPELEPNSGKRGTPGS